VVAVLDVVDAGQCVLASHFDVATAVDHLSTHTHTHTGIQATATHQRQRERVREREI